ncbi:EF-hand domain-containing protein [Rhizobium sp.]
MKLKTAFIAALAGVFTVTAAAPSFAAADPAKKEKRINRMVKRADLNGDGKISRSEMERGLAVTFAMIDANGDGVLSATEVANAKTRFKAERKHARAANEGRVHFVKFPVKRVNKRFDRLDANRDGQLSKAELQNVADRLFKKRDKNRDGFISASDYGY